MSSLNVFSVLCLSVFLKAVSSASISNLTCYECSDSFRNTWDPFTPCQRNLSAVRLRKCHSLDRYCKVERISLKSITISISRSCVSECYYGCKVYGYGITQLRCTSCCQGYACNTDNSSRAMRSSVWDIVFVMVVLMCSELFYGG